MPIPSPILDNRSYQQLRDDLVRRIPVYAPDWTDHNPSDPGITLIELFAFLGENLLFRFNQIPESTKLAYLRLLRIPLLPAVPARCLVTMTTEEPGGALVEAGSEVRAGALPFETATEARVWPVAVVAAAKIAAPAPDPATEPEAAEFALRAVDAMGDLAAGQTPAYYSTRTVPADDTRPPLDASLAVDGMIWVALLAGKGADPAKLVDALVNIGFVPDAEAPPIEQVSGCPGAGAVGAVAAPAVEWQVSTPEVDGAGSPVYRTLPVEGDSTRGLTRTGVVRLRLPRKSSEFGVVPEPDPDLAGTGDRAPLLDDEAAAKLICWLRAFRHDGSRFGKVQLVAVNAVETVQSRKALPEFVGTGNAQPNQVFRLANRPILEQSIVLEVEDNGAWRRWQETDSFHASRADDLHFIVDREAGEVQFGNGLQGHAPQIGRRIRAVEYRYGGGAAGNVAAKAITRFSGSAPVKVSNPLPARGGAESETVEAALDRIPGELRRRDRAVTAGDFQELALQTPGAGIGRAECLPRFHSPTKTPERPGVVSVVVWPLEDRANPNAPRPDRTALRMVCEWLDQRRLVTTELYVIPPAYRKIAVAVGLQVKPGYGVEAVRRWVELVLRQYTAPLPPFGPDGRGWPLGRRVHGPELEAAALQVEGVEFLEDLQLAGFDEGTQTWIPGTVTLEMYEVPEMTQVSVVEGPVTQLPWQAIAPPPGGQVPVPIPVVRQEC